MRKFLRKLFKSESEELENSLATMGLEFPDEEAAEKAFLQIREEKNQGFQRLVAELVDFDFSYRAASLKALEKIYFDIYIDKNKTCNLSQDEFKEHIDFYVQEIFIRNKIAARQVSENHFADGRYIDGLEFKDGRWGNGIYSEHISLKDNKKKDSLFNYFMQLVPEDMEHEI